MPGGEYAEHVLQRPCGEGTMKQCGEGTMKQRVARPGILEDQQTSSSQRIAQYIDPSIDEPQNETKLPASKDRLANTSQWKILQQHGQVST